MQINVNDVLSNFTVIRTCEIREFDGTLYEFKHNSTGAKLAWVKTKDENKVFSITFKTLPKDSTGVFHILEHSVLNGSEEYPTNSLFVELLKGSLKTFLNAATYSDRTEFPVSSRNQRDFMNLVKVYLDSTLFPLVLREPKIFEQEGWHYEIDEETGAPFVNGVVFNEMKGAFSSPETKLYSSLAASLFPDTSYGFVSGGAPSDIPKLSYESLKASHSEFYHPSNSYTYLDGDMDIEAVLELIDSYFSRFEKGHAKEFALQKPAPHKEVFDTYAAFDEEEGAYFCMGQLLDGARNKSELMAYNVLANYLTESNDSPLTKAILENGIAYDADFFIDPNCAQPYVGLTLRQMDAGKKEEAQSVIMSTLNRIIEEGISKEEILAEIDRLEYMIKDIEEPKGMNRLEIGMPAWIYDGDIMTGFSFDKILSDLRIFAENEKYVELLKRITFQGDGTALCMLTPSVTMEEEPLSESFTEKELIEIKQRCDDLFAWQNKVDSKETMNLIPRLSISDLDEPELMRTEVSEYENTTILFHPANTNGIHHYCLYFSAADFSLEEARLLSVLTNLYAELPTKQYGLLDLQTNLKRKIGVYDFNISAYSDRTDLTVCRPYFRVDFSVLENYENDAFALISEILQNTDFESEMSRDMIFMILMQCKEAIFESIQEGGSHHAAVRANSHLMASNAFADATEGIAFYEYLKTLIASYEEEISTLSEKMSAFSKKLFVADRMVASIVAPELGDKVKHLANTLGRGEAPKQTSMKLNLDTENKKEYFVIPSMVSYAAVAGLLPELRESYNGSCEVLSNIIDFDYLWNEIRVSGGAYGCGSFISANGSRGCSSYRDPSPLNSVDVFARQAEFLDEFLEKEEDLEPYIIGAYAAMTPLLHVRQQASRANLDYFLGVTGADRKRYQKELVMTTKEDLSKLRSNLSLEEERYAVCIIGSEEAFEEGLDYVRFELN